MSDDAELVRKAFKAFSDKGLDAALDYLDPEVEWWGPEDWLEERLYRGHDGIRRLTALWMETFDDYGVEIDEVKDVGDSVLVFGRQIGRMKTTGDRIEQAIGYVFEFRDRKVSRVDAYFSWDAAANAAARHARHSE